MHGHHGLQFQLVCKSIFLATIEIELVLDGEADHVRQRVLRFLGKVFIARLYRGGKDDQTSHRDQYAIRRHL
jgi:hypothetical protein